MWRRFQRPLISDLTYNSCSLLFLSEEGADAQSVLQEATELLNTKFGFHSITIQVELHSEDMSHCSSCQDPSDWWSFQTGLDRCSQNTDWASGTFSFVYFLFKWRELYESCWSWELCKESCCFFSVCAIGLYLRRQKLSLSWSSMPPWNPTSHQSISQFSFFNVNVGSAALTKVRPKLSLTPSFGDRIQVNINLQDWGVNTWCLRANIFLVLVFPSPLEKTLLDRFKFWTPCWLTLPNLEYSK